jgi:hypothetical protein
MATKLTAEDKDPTNVPSTTFLEFYRTTGSAKRDMETARSAYQSAMKAAKKAGIDTAMLTRARAIATSDDIQAELHGLYTLIRYLKYLQIPIGQQLEMELGSDMPKTAPVPDEAARQQALWDAEAMGWKAGRGGDNRDDNPHDEGTELHVQWDNGWIAGQKSIADDMADGKAPRARGRKGANGNAEDRPAVN